MGCGRANTGPCGMGCAHGEVIALGGVGCDAAVVVPQLEVAKGLAIPNTGVICGWAGWAGGGVAF